ncbi:hypothetical protein C8R45DRAFT_294206 [Mycena sanguinolenta]|nr:hypothetical protein C8R45DRAFT_294206 [Mycena sanguinolenta]
MDSHTTTTHSGTGSPGAIGVAVAGIVGTATRMKRQARHRHTQSLGLLSPIPSRTSLRSDAVADGYDGVESSLDLHLDAESEEGRGSTRGVPQLKHADTGMPVPTTPSRATSFSTTSTSTTSTTDTTHTTSSTNTPSTPDSPTTQRQGNTQRQGHRRTRSSLPALPALLASLSALFPGSGSAPSSPKVATMALVSAFLCPSALCAMCARGTRLGCGGQRRDAQGGA